MTRYQKPQDIIAYCLEPLDLNEQSPATKEAIRRLADVIKSLQFNAGPSRQASAFSKAPPIVINETAHGCDA